MSYYFQLNTAKAVRKLFPKIILNDLRQFPIKVLSKEDQKPFVELVNEIIELKKQSFNIDTTHLEDKIDKLVFRIYKLTDEEIDCVENK